MSGKNAWAFLPLIVSGRAVGCCVVSFDRPRLSRGGAHPADRAQRAGRPGPGAGPPLRRRARPRPGAAARPAAPGAARRCPPSPPPPAICRPARACEVGGDWYDVIPLSADRVALVIGDVMGHGLSEAATMGRLRTAVHTLADLELPPDELLAHLNDLVSELGDDFYATCLYAVYDPATASAPSPAPGTRRRPSSTPTARSTSPTSPPDPPLGAATPPFETIGAAAARGTASWCSTPTAWSSPPRRDIDTRHGAPGRGAGRRPRRRRTGIGRGPGASTGRVPTACEAWHLDRLCDALVAALLPAQQRDQRRCRPAGRPHPPARRRRHRHLAAARGPHRGGPGPRPCPATSWPHGIWTISS